MPTSKAITASKFFGKDRYEYYLNELLTEQSLGGQKLSKEQLKEGFSKRKNKISFEKFVDSIIQTKTAKAALSPEDSGPVSSGGFDPGGGALVISPGGELQNLIEGISKTSEAGGIESDISIITKTVVSIADILSKQKKSNEDAAAYGKRKAEQDKRALAESKLEKRFEGLKKAAEKIIAPVKSILDKILNFLVTVFLGRVVFKLIEWFGDPKNAEKVKTIIRFLGDQWPKLLSLYLVFGTSFGRFAKGLLKVVARSGIKLLGLIAKLAAAKKIRGAGKVARFLGGGKGKLLGNVIGTAAALGGTYALTQGLSGGDENKEPKAQGFSGGGDENKEPKPKAQGFSGGGYVTPRFPAFAGGGFNFKGMMGGASMGAMFGPLGMLLGGAFGSGKPQQMMSGFVSGEKGVDKVPAMLTDGEFVMSAGAVQKYGVDTLEAMNAAGGGTNKPKIMSGTTYAQGGGLIGDIPIDFNFGQNPDNNQMRRAARVFKQYGTEDELFKAFKKLGYIPDIQKMVGGENIYERIFQGHHGYDDALDAIRKSVADKVKAVNNPQSFTQSSRAAAGLDDLAKRFDMDAKTAPRYGENLPRLGRPKPKITRIDPSRMLPAAGESSANAMRAAAKAAKNVRAPIPASRAIVPYTGGGLARTGITGGLSVPQIKTNMRVPGGFGNLKSLGAELLLNYLVQSGLDYVEAKRLTSTIEKARKESPEKLVNRIEKLRELVDKEERFQKSFGGILQKVIALGGETGSEVLSRQAKTILAGVGAKTFQGGAVKGGYGLKNQSFKDMPKTQIMTDDKGRPFVGYKAMRGGKPVYVRGPQPGTGTTNPFEMLGRMINPGAYKENDQRLAMQKQKVAMVNSLESLQARGASIETQKRMMMQMGGNLKDVQNDLNYRKKTAQIAKTKPSNRRGAAPSSIRPPTKPAPKIVYGPPVPSSKPRNRRGGTTKTPNFSATSSSSSAAKLKTLGVVGR